VGIEPFEHDYELITLQPPTNSDRYRGIRPSRTMKSANRTFPRRSWPLKASRVVRSHQAWILAAEPAFARFSWPKGHVDAIETTGTLVSPGGLLARPVHQCQTPHLTAHRRPFRRRFHPGFQPTRGSASRSPTTTSLRQASAKRRPSSSSRSSTSSFRPLTSSSAAYLRPISSPGPRPRWSPVIPPDLAQIVFSDLDFVVNDLWGGLMAGASMATIPLLAIYLILQRQVVDAFVRSGLR
jgi:hypothetical protein